MEKRLKRIQENHLRRMEAKSLNSKKALWSLRNLKKRKVRVIYLDQNQ